VTTERIPAGLLDPFSGDAEAVLMRILVFLCLLTVGESALREGLDGFARGIVPIGRDYSRVAPPAPSRLLKNCRAPPALA